MFKQQKDTQNVGYEKSLYRCMYVHKKLIVLWLIIRRKKGATLQLFISLSHSGPKGLEPGFKTILNFMCKLDKTSKTYIRDQ